MATISAGRLDRTIKIQRATTTSGPFNEPIETWTDYFTCRAMRRDVSDGEKFASGQVGSSLRSRFTVRSSSETRSVTPVDRIIHDGGTWSIQGVKEADEGRRRFIEITAVRDAD